MSRFTAGEPCEWTGDRTTDLATYRVILRGWDGEKWIVTKDAVMRLCPCCAGRIREEDVYSIIPVEVSDGGETLRSVQGDRS